MRRYREMDEETPGRRLSPWLVGGLIAGGVLFLGSILVLFLLLVTLMGSGGGSGGSRSQRDWDNAQCPLCKHTFRIPEEHRGTTAELTRHYHCPNCDVSSPVRWLYRKDAGSARSRRQ